MPFQVCFGQKDAGAVGTLVIWVAVMFFRHASNSSIQFSLFHMKADLINLREGNKKIA
jgi:hypothetical protein